jgi:threonine synthase
MHYQSTRSADLTASFSAAIEQGLAPDGGLYVPAQWPRFAPSDFDGLDTQPEVGARLLAPFAAGDPLAAQLPNICRDAFNFPVPLKPVSADGRLSVLELFHGPTAAFKDFGARFLAATLSRARAANSRELHILVATSGDTGGAVAAAFHRLPGFRVSVLYPKGLVSPTQERQLTCWGDNVQSFRVAGTFDDCQRLVKQAFVDSELKQQFDLSSANSINLGRLLPQAVHFALSSLWVWRRTGQRASFVVPGGNLGHGVACSWARHVGLPIDAIVFAHNANRTVPDFLATGEWQPRTSIPTLASAMDVGNPSNMERLRALFPDLASIRGAVRAESVDDAAIANRIKADYRAYAQTWCPHTAAAAEVHARMSAAEREKPWILAATAHPAKFREIVEPLIAVKLAIPNTLAALFDRPTQATDLQPSLSALKSALRA